MNSKSKRRVVISGGGTGGHLFPAIAIANALKSRDENIEILFVGAQGKMEMEKVPLAGYEIVGLPVAGLQRSLSPKNLLLPFKVISSLLKVRKVLRRFTPDVVVGVGGYASGPCLKMANIIHIPTLIQEQNSFPGLTNRYLAKKAAKVCVAYDGLASFFGEEKLVKTGNPVRRNVVDLEGKRMEGITFFRLEEDLKTLLVVGGSLGAWAINEAIEKQLDEYVNHGIQIVWQTGKPFFKRAVDAVKERGLRNVKVVPFIQQMDLAYAAADIIVSRAGAIAISELSFVQKPTILVPLPTAAENHQYKNAMALVDKKAAILVENDKVKEELCQLVTALSVHEKKCTQLAENIGKMAIKDADVAIAQEVIKLMK